MTLGNRRRSSRGPAWPAMVSMQATPSSSALCASIGPSITSPIAQTPATLVWKCASMTTRPRCRRAARRPLQAEALRVRAAGRWRPARRRPRASSAAPPGRRLDRHGCAPSPSRRRSPWSPSWNFMPCLVSDALELLGDLAVHARRDAVEELDHRHLGAEPAPHRAQLQPDDAGADHDQAASGTSAASARRWRRRSASRRPSTPGSGATPSRWR